MFVFSQKGRLGKYLAIILLHQYPQQMKTVSVKKNMDVIVEEVVREEVDADNDDVKNGACLVGDDPVS